MGFAVVVGGDFDWSPRDRCEVDGLRTRPGKPNQPRSDQADNNETYDPLCPIYRHGSIPRLENGNEVQFIDTFSNDER
jgi:hypothetical protein